jgi:NADPH:quinone reductase-like Zn-dependent oxidoreductase
MKMKAIVYTKFGPPEVLQLKEIEKPTPAENEILIRIFATTVEKEDPDYRSKRGFNGFIKPRHQILGLFIAGEIEAVGSEVTKFKVGDQVYGSTTMSLGACAEYICLSEDAALVQKPSNFSYDEAVAVLNGVITALPYLREKGNFQSGQKILINGASGSVGSAAVQLAKYLGASQITGVCSTTNLELVKSLGADKVIDYTKEDFTKFAETYDVVFDCVGKSSYSKCKNLLKSGGVFLTTIPNLMALFNKRIKFTATGLRKANKKIADLLFVNKIIEEGKLKAVIDSRFPMEKIADAHILVAKGHKKDSIVVKMK